MKLFRAVAAVLVFRLARWCAEVGALIIVKQRVTNASSVSELAERGRLRFLKLRDDGLTAKGGANIK
jgi:hypothetical protein